MTESTRALVLHEHVATEEEYDCREQSCRSDEQCADIRKIGAQRQRHTRRKEHENRVSSARENRERKERAADKSDDAKREDARPDGHRFSLHAVLQEIEHGGCEADERDAVRERSDADVYGPPVGIEYGLEAEYVVADEARENQNQRGQRQTDDAEEAEVLAMCDEKRRESRAEGERQTQVVEVCERYVAEEPRPLGLRLSLLKPYRNV